MKIQDIYKRITMIVLAMLMLWVNTKYGDRMLADKIGENLLVVCFTIYSISIAGVAMLLVRMARVQKEDSDFTNSKKEILNYFKELNILILVVLFCMTIKGVGGTYVWYVNMILSFVGIYMVIHLVNMLYDLVESMVRMTK